MAKSTYYKADENVWIVPAGSDDLRGIRSVYEGIGTKDFMRQHMTEFSSVPDTSDSLKRVAKAAEAMGLAFGKVSKDALGSGLFGASPAIMSATAGLTGAGKAFSLADIEAAAARLKKEKMETAETTADPTGWKMTSLRWIRENAPHYASSVSHNAHDGLSRALAAMSYREAETAYPDGTLDKKAAASMRAADLLDWDMGSHTKLRAFLDAGGHEAAMKARMADPKTRRPVTERMYDPSLSVSTTSKPVMAREQTLDDVVRELSNPAQGSW